MYPNPAANREIYLLECFYTVHRRYAVVYEKNKVMRDCLLPLRWGTSIDVLTQCSQRRRVDAEPLSKRGREREQR